MSQFTEGTHPTISIGKFFPLFEKSRVQLAVDDMVLPFKIEAEERESFYKGETITPFQLDLGHKVSADDFDEYTRLYHANAEAFEEILTADNPLTARRLVVSSDGRVGFNAAVLNVIKKLRLEVLFNLSGLDLNQDLMADELHYSSYIHRLSLFEGDIRFHSFNPAEIATLPNVPFQTVEDGFMLHIPDPETKDYKSRILGRFSL